MRVYKGVHLDAVAVEDVGRSRGRARVQRAGHAPGVQGLALRVWSVGVGIWGLGFGVEGIVFGV